MTLPSTVYFPAVLADRDSLSWVEHSQHGRQGSRIHTLYRCEKTGQHVALVDVRPGAHADEHEHGGHESIFVIEGSYRDDFGIHRKGDLVVYEPGSRHSWHSAEGGLMYVVWGGNVARIEPREDACLDEEEGCVS